MIFRVYPHSVNNKRNICKAYTYRLVRNEERIEELKNELVKYGSITIYENCAEHITEIRLIVKVPYKRSY